MTIGQQGLSLVMYLGTGTRVQCGAVTGASYRFLSGEMRYVDSRDLANLLTCLTQDGTEAFIEVGG